MLQAVHFERPAYAGGEVTAGASAAAFPARTRRRIAVEGEVPSERSCGTSSAAGQAGLALGRAEDLPAGFRQFRLELELDGFVAARTLGVEIAHADGAARAAGRPAGPHRRGAGGGRGARRARHRNGPGAARHRPRGTGDRGDDRGGARADRGLLGLRRLRAGSADLGARPPCRARCRRRCAGRSTGDARLPLLARRARQRRAVVLLGEPRAALPHRRLPRRSPAARRAVRPLGAVRAPSNPRSARDRVRAWLDHFERWEMAEFNSAPYFPIDLKGLTALFALAPDPDIRERAGRGIVRLLEIVANSAHQGMLTAAQGRSYEHSLRAGWSLGAVVRRAAALGPRRLRRAGSTACRNWRSACATTG